MTAHARTTDPGTSHESTKSVWKPNAVQAIIIIILEADEFLQQLHTDGMTDQEIVNAYRHYAALRDEVFPSEQSIRSRRKELADRGVVVFSGVYSETDSGRRTQKWVLR